MTSFARAPRATILPFLARHVAAATVVALASFESAPAVQVSAEPGLSITVQEKVIVDLIHAAVPYHLELDAALFTQKVNLSNPRNIHLVPGGLDLEMTASGTPVPFTAEVAPRVRLQRLESGGWVVRVQELPVSMGALGTYDLAAFIEPVDIETITRYVLQLPAGEVELDLAVQAIDISDKELKIELAASFPGAAHSR